MLMSELAARCGDIPSSAGADMTVDPLLAQHTLEMMDIIACGAIKLEPIHFVVSDQVDIGAELFDDCCELFRVFGLIVHTPEQDVFQGDFSAGFFKPA